MSEYKVGDKVVLEVAGVGKTLKGVDLLEFNDGDFDILINSPFFKGKLEDFQPKQEKIKFTPEMKKEFDELNKKLFLNYSSNVYKTMCTLVESDNFPELNAKVAGSFDKQMNLLNCLRNPSLIEVVEPERYRVRIGFTDLCYVGGKWTFDKQKSVKLTLDEVKQAEKQLGIQGLQAKWHEAAEESKDE